MESVTPNKQFNTLLREEAIAELVKCQNNRDTEAAHVIADDVLCKLLDALGYSDVVAEYAKVDKWCA